MRLCMHMLAHTRAHTPFAPDIQALSAARRLLLNLGALKAPVQRLGPASLVGASSSSSSAAASAIAAAAAAAATAGLLCVCERESVCV